MANDLSRSEVDRIVYACRQSGDDSTYAIVNAALASTTGEAEPVAEDAWPKLDKPAMVGGGSFGKGVTTRFVVEAAQRLYEREAENRSKTPEQRIEDERNRRAAWDLFNGNPFAATPAAPGEVTDALADFLEAQDALDNREYQGINGEDYSTLMRRRNSARAALDAALAHPAPVAAPAPASEALTLILLSTGEYSDYGVMGAFRPCKSFTVGEAMDAFKAQWKPEANSYSSAPDPTDFAAWLAKEGYVEDANTEEIHLGSYGDLDLSAESKALTFICPPAGDSADAPVQQAGEAK